MRFICHKRSCPGLRLSDRACPKCGLQFSLRGVLKYSVSFFGKKLTKALSVSCPACRSLIPAFQSKCRKCGNSLTLEGAVEATISPHRKRVQEFLAPNAPKMRMVQWAYLAASALIFWAALARLEAKYSAHWAENAMLSVIYLAVFLLLSLWLVPQRTLVVIAERASKLVKLGLVFNYLTALFFLQMFFSHWWSRSFMLGGLFIATWGGAWVFWRFLWPMSVVVSNIFVSREVPFDPTAPQGRSVRLD
jgi:hypothetical protein